MARKLKGFRRPRPILFVAAIAALALLGWLGSSFARPFLMAADMAKENVRLEKQSMEMQIQQQELRKDHALLNTDAGMERESRRKGYLKPDEVPLIIPDSSRGSAPRDSAPQ